ncbi:hypothetical protein MIMGU_mgv1a018445mg [Erythranthe guttata]|uniref:F-box domain-containing protein n=2 Tax=Erythranthe guttata TaxID=4155 RepID=A0A022PWW2_ERYGU|nr:hypothetical protein MIMGU_mgv1a018445mg [Erythranthe guttata]
MKKRQTYVPSEIIENILLRLPVKSLMRFKCVSKSWEATISDPEFIANHLRQAKETKKKKSSSDDDKDLLLWVGKRSLFIIFPPSDSYLRERPLTVLCYCDGFVLGLYYDPLIKDYKIVATDMKSRYSIYTMGKKSWSHEMKEMEIDIPGTMVCCDKGSPFEGDTYWVLRTRTRTCQMDENFLVCFDSKQEKFEKFPMPIREYDNQCRFFLTYLGDHMCLAYHKAENNNFVDRRINQLWFVKRAPGGGGGGGSSVEFKEAMPFSSSYIESVYLTNENEIALEDGWRKSYTAYKYNLVTKTCAEIKVTPNTGYPHSPLYLENMFFSSSPNKTRKDTEESTAS